MQADEASLKFYLPHSGNLAAYGREREGTAWHADVDALAPSFPPLLLLLLLAATPARLTAG